MALIKRLELFKQPEKLNGETFVQASDLFVQPRLSAQSPEPSGAEAFRGLNL